MKATLRSTLHALAGLLAAAVLTSSALAATLKTVTIDLGGKVFSDSLDFTAESTDLLLPSARYDYKVNATITGSGALNQIIPAGTPLATFLDLIKPGSSSFLTGVTLNPSGKLPFTKLFKKVFSGTIQVGQVPVTASLVLSAGIGADGKAGFSASKISLRLPLGLAGPAGGVTFDANSNVVIGNELLGTDGTYTGLINTNDPTTSGIASLTLAKTGKVTGVVTVGGKRHPFKGALGGNGISNAITLIGPDTILTLTLNLQAGVIIGVTTGPTAINFIASKAAFSKAAPFSKPGTYNTLLLASGLPQGKTAADIPQGPGYGTLKIKADGSVALLLVLGDKSKVTAKGVITAGGSLTFYVPLQKGAGELIGLLTVDPLATTPKVLGGLRWIKAMVTGTKPFAAGFDTTVNTQGELYTKPAAGAALLPSPLNLIVSFGNLGVAAFQQQFTIDAAGKATATPPNAQSVKVKLKAANGLFSGSFKTPGATPKTIKFSGLILPNNFAGAAGLFVGVPAAGTAVETGSVTLQ